MKAASLPLPDAERLAWLRLIRTENVGPITFRDLLRHFDNATAALEALPRLAGRAGSAARVCTMADAEREMAAAARQGIALIALPDPAYPRWLATLDDAPPILAVRGNPAVLDRPSIAIVGSRNASAVGRKFAMQIAAGLGDAGFVVVSGLARGIDAAAHMAALAGGTIAVFAGGLDRPYPPENVPLAESIVANGGALVSEMPLGWEARARDFPRRNRLVSGLTVATVVVEAALRSGSLITARRAAEQGRLVFAVPGSPLDPRAAGANQLIKDGAMILTDVADVIAEVGPMIAPERPRPPLPIRDSGGPIDAPEAADETDHARIVEALGPSPVAIDDLIRLTGAKPATVHLVLMELDLAGRLARHAGARVSITG